MNDIQLDITPFEEKISLHSYLKDQLKFPFYYGANLDALYDELTSIEEPLAIALTYHDHPITGHERYIPRMVEVFKAAAQDNYNIRLTLREAETK
ncbi:MAG TPA: barstar family protein [Candidatus Limiplasma sp.]|nr:barstar family protein [Candidatus Limiplasma sp.]HRX07811.1 barstar family protein [Candidatus Limiplasma sp.]